MTDNLFERASREQFRYPSSKGNLTTEQLWELPLTSRNGVSLDTVARALHAALKDTQEGISSVTAGMGSNDPRVTTLEAKLEIVKRVIAVRLAENEAAKVAREKAERKAKLLEALADKQDASLRSMSEDEIRAQLAEL